MSPGRILRVPGRAAAFARLMSVFLVFVLVVAAFAGGVVTSERPGLADDPITVWIYYAAGLFVFGGLDLGTPVGGMAAGRAALWIAYFLAPAITTSAVIEGLLRLVRPQWLKRRRLDGHMVLVGAGQVGMAYLEALRSVEPERPVLLIDRSAGLATAEEAVRRPGVEFLQGNAQRAATIEALQLERAHGIVVVTDSDLVNLEAAWAAHAEQPSLPIAVHVADLALLRPVERIAHDDLAPVGFNTHQIGAFHLYRNHLASHFEETGYRDVVVLAGFGRFGQTILEVLLDEAADELEQVVIVDRAASALFRQFEADISHRLDRAIAIDREVSDPAAWDEVDRRLAESEATPVYVLCAADERLNLRAAMLLRDRSSAPRIFVRCFHRSSFAGNLAEQLSLELLAFEDVLRDALRDHYRRSFCRPMSPTTPIGK
jgi:Trk K+ transport system NAD-binding subunit